MLFIGMATLGWLLVASGSMVGLTTMLFVTTRD